MYFYNFCDRLVSLFLCVFGFCVKNSENATGGTIRQISELKEGISQENAKKIITQIKSLKLKIQIKIQGEELRADGKKRDDLQEAIAAIKTIDIGLPIEFVNFRE